MPRRLLVTLVAVLALGAAAATGGAWGGAPGWDNWNCNLLVYWGTLGGIPADTGDYFGVQPGATDGYDLIDSKKPAEPLGDYVYAWFERPSWGQGRIMADWRAPIADGTSKRWGTSTISDTWNVKTNIDNGGSGYYDPMCDIFNELEYPIAADIYIDWEFGVAENPPYPVPPDDYTFTIMYRFGINAKPAGTGSPSGAPVPAGNTMWDMEAVDYLVIPLWNEAFQPWDAQCGFAAADTAKYLFIVNNPDTQPTCAIDVSPPSPQMEPATYTFTATACCDEPYTFAWDFGDATSDTGNPVSHTYSGGTYTVTCTVTDANGDTATCTADVEAIGCPDVQCCFTYAPTSPLPGETVQFTDCSTGGTINSWAWDFGDGGSDTVQNPTHVYAAEGTYTVCLTVGNDCGNSATCCQDVTVVIPCVEPICCIEGPVEVTVCEPATWTDCSEDPTPGGGIVSRAWYLDVPCEGLGELHINPGFEAGWHTVNQPCGNETGMIGDGWMAWDDGCWGNPYLYFDSGPEVCEGEHAQAVEYDSGSEGFYNLVEGLVPGKTYLVSGCIRIDSGATWWAEFGVSDADPPAPGGGCTSPDDPYPADPWLWKSDGWGLGPAPGAWYNVGPYRCTPVGTMLLVWFKFGNSGSPSIGYGDAVSVVAAPDGTEETYTKHFTEAGDAGPHVITLVVTNACGLTACCSQQFNVVLPPCDCGDITADPAAPKQGETVNFSVATVGCTAPVTYEWDFECDSVYDYTATDDNTASHAYDTCGWTTVCVRVTDNLGQQCESFFDIFVDCPPVCQIDGPTSVKAGDLACFSGAGSSDPDGGSIVSYEWDFGQPADATGLITNPSFETGDMDGWTDFGAIPMYLTPNPFPFCGINTLWGDYFVARETCQSAAQGGSYQVISGLDPTYAYGLSAHIVGFEADGGDPALEYVRVGFDPNGGTDPNAGSVVWGPNTISPDCAFDAGVTADVVFQPTAGSGTVFFMCNTQDWACIGVHALDNLVLTRLSVGSGSEACYTYSYDPLNTLVTVTLCVTDDEGSTTCCTQEVTILPADNLPPLCDFTYSPANPTDLDTVQFTDASTDPDVDDAIVAWAWDFGDGGTSTDQNPTHAYADDGTYNVCLTVTDSGRGGQSDPLSSTCCKDVTVSNVGPECCISGPTSGQATVELCWESCSTDPDGTIVAYSWDFGDPGPNLKPDGGFETGFYPVVDDPCPGDVGDVGAGWIPWVDGDCGWMAPYVFFDSTAEVCEGAHAQGVEYNNGSKGVCNIMPVTAGMTYLVSGCIRIDSGGCYWAEFGVADGTVGPPECGIGCTSPDDPYPGDPWLFKQDGWGLGPAPGAWYVCGPYRVTPVTDLMAIWYKFGNGCGTPSVGYADGVTVTLLAEPVTTPVACHTYTAEGEYQVCLTVTDDDGASETCCITVTIAENHAPDCCFTYAPAEPCDDAPVQFTDCSTDVDGNNIVAWAWDFGDGSSDTVQNPSHLFAAGSYEVCLTVTDDGTPPLSSTCCQTIDVCHVNEPPTCEITSGPATLTRGEEGCFEATASDPDGTIVSYSWNLDGGTQSYGWWDMYEGDVVPLDAGWNRYEGDLVGEIVDLGGGNNGWHLVDPSDRKGKFAKSPPMGGGVTVVSRMKLVASNDDNSMYAPCYIEGDDSAQHVRARGGLGHIKIDRAATGNGNYGTLNYGQWYTLRLTAGAGAGQWHLYMDENPVAVGSGDCSADGSDRISIGANSTGNTGEIVVDYVYIALGAWAPGDAMGPQIPGAPQGDRICATWDTLGVKTVCLTVTDDAGATAECCTTVEIVNIPPTCSIEADPALSVVDRPTTFTATGSDADGSVVSYAWDFGDGGTDSGNPVVHTYTAAASYTVTCTVTDNDGGVGSCTLVVEANPAPICVISGDTHGCTCQQMCFDGSASSDPDGGVISYCWDVVPDLAISDPSFETGAGWTIYSGGGMANSFGFCGYTVGRTGPKFFGNATSWGTTNGKAYQVLGGAVAGANYEAEIWVNSVSWQGSTQYPENVHTRVGVDPAGGTDPAAAVWSPDGGNQNCNAGPYQRNSVVFTATGPNVTVFCEYWNDDGREWSIMALDDVAVRGLCSGTDATYCKTFETCGEHTVTLTVTDDEGISSTCEMTVTIADCCPPEIIECPADRNLQADETGMAPAPDLCPEVVATDDCDEALDCSQDPAAGTMLPYGDTIITLTVCDDAGNCASCETTVTVGDGTPPVITCPDPGPYSVGEDCTVPCPAATATDNVDPAPVVTQNPAAGDPLAPGEYSIQVEACDFSGNCSTAVCPITVVDDTPPDIACAGEIVACNDPGVCEAAVDLVTCVGEPVPLANPSFEDGDTTGCGTVWDMPKRTVAPGWTKYGDTGQGECSGWPVADVFVHYPHTGDSMFHHQIGWGTGIIGVYQQVAVEPGEDYALSAWAYVMDDSWCYRNYLMVDVDGGTDPAGADASVEIGPTDWQQYSVNFTATGPTATIFCELDFIWACYIGSLSIDDVTLEKIVCTGAATATDNCGVVSLENDAPATFPVGTTTVTWTACDAAGNCSSCEQLVTVNDCEPPTLECPADVEVCTDPGVCEATGVALGDATASDNCAVTSLTNDAPASYPLGTTTVTWTACDDAGNCTSCEQTVTVIDCEPPVITCPADVEICTDPGECSAASCGLESVELVNPGFETGDWTGWTSNGMDLWNHGDWGMPAHSGTKMAGKVSSWGGISANAVQEVHGLEAGASYTACAYILSLSANYYNGTLCDPSGQSASVMVDVDCDGTADASSTIQPSYPPEYKLVCVEFTAAGECARIILDSWSIPGGCEWRFNMFDDVSLAKEVCVMSGATATDNCGVASITNDAPAVLPLGTTVVTWTATDTSGNTASCTQNITVVDCEDPSITCPEDITTCTDPGACTATVDLGTADAGDNCGVASLDNDAPVAFPVGTTVVTWTACDAAGNCTSCEQTVTVNDCEAPSIECPPDIDTCTDPGACTATVDLGTATASDNCGVASLTNDGLAAYPVGLTVVTWTACDDAGNCTSCEQTVVVSDCEPPTIACPDDVTVTSPECEPVQVDIGTASASDNCGVVSLSNDAPAQFQPGVATVVTWTACDAAGNCSSCEQTVDVNCPPTCSITYAPASPTTDDAIVFSANGSDVDGTIVSVAWDFGDGDTATGDPATHQYAMPGGYTVTATVCDNDGLCATCTADVTVDKGTNIPPECGDPAITTTPDPPIATEPVTLESNAWDPNPWGVIVSYEWDFGDGGTASGNPVTHTFAEAICYTVCVTVTDDQGGVTECCEQVCVRPLCDCYVAIDRTHCKMPAAGHVGQCKRGQIGARNLSATEPCDVILRVTDNADNVVFESDPVTIEPGRRIRLRFDHCYTADEIGRQMWTWEVWPAECNDPDAYDNVYQRKVIVHP